MEYESLWLKGIDEGKIKSLSGNLDVDVLIVGGGMTGLSTAYHLKDSNLKVALVDRNLVAHGVSSKTTGKLTYLQDLIYTKIKKNYSQDFVKMYFNSQVDAISLVDQIISSNHISCDFEKVDSFIFTNNQKEIKKLKNEKKLLEDMGVKVRESNLPINFPSLYAISVHDTAVFHPVKYLLALKNICIKHNIDIYENTCISNMVKRNNKYYCKTSNGIITCNKVVIACHYPFFLLPFFFPIKGHIERSYLSASLVNKNRKFSAIDTSLCTNSMRYHSSFSKSYFIYLSGSHVLGNNMNAKKKFKKLGDNLSDLSLKPEYIWSNHDIITNDSLPYIGCVRPGDNTLLIGTGYNTWGMTNGSIAGKILSDLILEQENKYVPLFDPHRSSFAANLKNIPLNICYSVKPYVQNFFVKNKKWYSENIYFKTVNGKSIGIFDDGNDTHCVDNVCPHMKCNLVFNESEKTWDCHCHGSRFSLDGKCIQGPSKYDISHKGDL